MTQEATDSARQMDALFEACFHNSHLRIEGVQQVCIGLSLFHPAGEVSEQRPGASFDKKTSTIFASAQVDYRQWVRGDWASRVAAFTDAAISAAKAIFKTRISDAERRDLIEFIRACGAEITAHPPAQISPVLPVQLGFLSGEDHPSRVSYRSGGIESNFPGRVVELRPDQLAETDLSVGRHAESPPEMFKLYLRKEGCLHYHEAWVSDGFVDEHVGICGSIGQTTRHPADGLAAQRRMMAAIKASASTLGFRGIPQSRHARLLFACKISGMGGPAELERGRALEGLLNDRLGWLGLGHCDGGSIGLGTMEVLCFVVDAAIAKAALTPILIDAGFGDFTMRTIPKG